MTTREKRYELGYKIIELKRQLRLTDYKAIKYAEGELTAAEYAETKAQRKAWREEINSLENEIQALKTEAEQAAMI